MLPCFEWQLFVVGTVHTGSLKIKQGFYKDGLLSGVFHSLNENKTILKLRKLQLQKKTTET